MFNIDLLVIHSIRFNKLSDVDLVNMDTVKSYSKVISIITLITPASFCQINTRFTSTHHLLLILCRVCARLWWYHRLSWTRVNTWRARTVSSEGHMSYYEIISERDRDLFTADSARPDALFIADTSAIVIKMEAFTNNCWSDPSLYGVTHRSMVVTLSTTTILHTN